MSSYNDYLDSAEKAKFYGQQAGWAGDKRQQDYYNAEADRYFIMAMNQKMKEDEREAAYQNYYAQQEQRRMLEQQREMQIQQYINEQGPISPKAAKIARRNHEKLMEEIRKETEKEIKRRASLTPSQRFKEDAIDALKQFLCL